MSEDVKTKLQPRQYEMIKTAHLLLWQLIMSSLYKCILHIFTFKLKQLDRSRGLWRAVAEAARKFPAK